MPGAGRPGDRPTVDLCVMPSENADRSCRMTAEPPGTFDGYGTRV